MLNKRQKKELKDFIKAMCWLLSGTLQFAALIRGSFVSDMLLFVLTVIGWLISAIFWLVNAYNTEQRIIYCISKLIYLFCICAYTIFIK